MKKNYSDLSLGATLFILSFVARFIHLNLPGLHGDEAFSGLQTKAIISGKFMVVGMNNYTGAFFDYLRVPFFYFSQNIFGLRILSVAVSSLAVVALFALLRRYFDRKASFLGALVFSFSTWFFLTSRIAWEVCFFPSIIILVLYALLSGKKILMFFAGLLCALALWSHMIFIAALIPIVAIAIICDRSKSKFKYYLIALSGFVVGLLPKIIQIFQKGLDLTVPVANQGKTFQGYLLNAFSDLASFFAGDIEYVRQFSRFNISLDKTIIALAGLVLVAGVFVAIFKNRKALTFILLSLISCVISILIISYAAPYMTYRYLLIPLAFLTLSICFAASVLAQQKFLQVFSFVLALALVFGWFVNFYRYPKNPAIIKFHYGTIDDTSAHFLPSEQFYNCLKSNFSEKPIYADIFIYRILSFYNMNSGSLQIKEKLNNKPLEKGSYYVTYSSDKVPDGFSLEPTCTSQNFILVKY